MGNTSSQTLLDQIEVRRREIEALRRQINILIEKEKKRKKRRVNHNCTNVTTGEEFRPAIIIKHCFAINLTQDIIM